MVAQTPENVGLLVQKYLNEDAGAGHRVRVVADQIRLGDPQAAWWWVPVAFQADPYKLYYYYELFSSIEEKLEAQERLNVLLVPRVTPVPEEGPN